MEAAPSKSIQTKSPVLPRKRDESSRYLWAARVGGGKGREEEEERERERERDRQVVSAEVCEWGMLPR